MPIESFVVYDHEDGTPRPTERQLALARRFAMTQAVQKGGTVIPESERTLDTTIVGTDGTEHKIGTTVLYAVMPERNVEAASSSKSTFVPPDKRVAELYRAQMEAEGRG